MPREGVELLAGGYRGSGKDMSWSYLGLVEIRARLTGVTSAMRVGQADGIVLHSRRPALVERAVSFIT